MKELNEEIKLTIKLMQPDIDDGAHGELQSHLYSLLEMKRNEIQQRLTLVSNSVDTETDIGSCYLSGIDLSGFVFDKGPKPLTAEELKAGDWLCTDVSKECANALKSKNLRVFNSDEWGDDGLWVGCVIDACGEVKRKGLFYDFVGKKQIHRIGNEFYWGNP